jgi:hypothetical protein
MDGRHGIMYHVLHAIQVGFYRQAWNKSVDDLRLIFEFAKQLDIISWTSFCAVRCPAESSHQVPGLDDCILWGIDLVSFRILCRSVCLYIILCREGMRVLLESGDTIDSK